MSHARVFHALLHENWRVVQCPMQGCSMHCCMRTGEYHARVFHALLHENWTALCILGCHSEGSSQSRI